MKTILVDERIPEKCERSLLKEGFEVIKLPYDPDLGEAVKSHPDTLIFHIENELITTADYCDRAAYIFSDLRQTKNVRISFSWESRGSRYPRDAIMNGLVINKNVYTNLNIASDSLKNRVRELGYNLRHTNQGYPACVVLAFGNSAITADTGMAKILAEDGVRVTFISNRHISLPPHEYGFIGGASVVCGDKVYFFGNIEEHPDYEIISSALMEEGFKPISLSDEPLIDLGGGIIL